MMSKHCEPDTFTKLVNADLADRKKSDPAATFEDSVKFVAKAFPDLWDRHIHRVGSEPEI